MQSQDNEVELETQNAIKSDRIKLGIGGVVFVVIVMVSSSIIYLSQSHDEERNMVATEVTVVDPSPMSTPAPIERRKYRVEILNASGEVGLAGTVKEQLLSSQQDNPLVELAIEVGNAEAQTGITVIYLNEQLKRSPLSAVIAGEWGEAKIEVDAELDYDVQIIIGR